MTFQTDGDQQTDRVNTEANVDDVKVTNGNIVKDFQRRYGLSFPPENQLHNARLLLIQRIENAVLTIADKKNLSQVNINAAMYRMLKGNNGNIASQPTLTKRLLKFEKDNGISKTPTPVKPSASKSVPSTSSPSNDKQQEASIESALKTYVINME